MSNQPTLRDLVPNLKATTPQYNGEWTADILKTLRTEMPPELILKRPWDENADPDDPDTDMMSWMPWQTYADILDVIVPNWSQDYLGMFDDGRYVTVWLALEINGVRRVNCGTYDRENPNESGDPYSGAYSAAFRRTAALFGLGRFFYYKNGEARFEDLFPPTKDQVSELAVLLNSKVLTDKAKTALAKEPRWTIASTREFIGKLKKLKNKPKEKPAAAAA